MQPTFTFKQLLQNPNHLLAFGFGSGLAPKAPGTAGTLAAIPLFIALSQLPYDIYLGLCLLTFILGISICGASAKALGVKDHSGIVWDEFVGLWVTLAFVPALFPTELNLETLIYIFAGFVLFRIFDIAKPWPISWVDRYVGGGFGIMLDDLLAGLLAGIGLILLNHFIVF
ncbi:MAG: phosphatidylglycerophosphatase A [Pseudomonadales bacterium]|nr:phosphatidylglycerophosphatase A [Pseudomonadales bacterium]